MILPGTSGPSSSLTVPCMNSSPINRCVPTEAKSGDKILMASYGFGAGSDAMSLEVTPLIESKRPVMSLARMLDNKKMVDYATACRLEYKYAQDLSPLYV